MQQQKKKGEKEKKAGKIKRFFIENPAINAMCFYITKTTESQQTREKGYIHKTKRNDWKTGNK